MKHLLKYSSKSEYLKDYYDGKLSFPHVCSVPGEVIYAESFESEVGEGALPLYIEAINSITVSFSTNDIQYSLNNSTWIDLPKDTSTPSVSSGNKIYFRATGLTATSAAGIGTFTINGDCNVGGNVMSMLHDEDFQDNQTLPSYAFRYLFKGQESIITSDKLVLPSLNLSTYCYYEMFSGCSNMIAPPKLPALTLQNYCYYGMFKYCQSLVVAPDLPSPTIPSYSYAYMFYGCTSITKTPKINAVIDSYIDGSYYSSCSNSCYYMFYNCVSLVDASSMVIHDKDLGSYTFAYCFANCSSLVYLPNIQCNSCNGYAFSHMFENCISLVKALDLSLITQVYEGSFEYMYANCVNLIEAPGVLKHKTYSYLYRYMFYNCSNLITAPDLLSTSSSSYSSAWQYMFSGCCKLSRIKWMYNTNSWPSNNATSYWVSDVAPKGTFIKNKAATYTITKGTSTIPSGWTIEDAEA